MSPPDAPGIPRARLPSVREIDGRPRHQQVEAATEADEGSRPSRLEQEAFGRAVHVRWGKLRLAIPLALFGALAGGGGVLAYQQRHGNTPEALALSDNARDQLNAEVLARLAKLDSMMAANKNEAATDTKLLIQRVSNLETQNAVTQGQLTAILMQLRAR